MSTRVDTSLATRMYPDPHLNRLVFKSEDGAECIVPTHPAGDDFKVDNTDQPMPMVVATTTAVNRRNACLLDVYVEYDAEFEPGGAQLVWL